MTQEPISMISITIFLSNWSIWLFLASIHNFWPQLSNLNHFLSSKSFDPNNVLVIHYLHFCQNSVNFLRSKGLRRIHRGFVVFPLADIIRNNHSSISLATDQHTLDRLYTDFVTAFSVLNWWPYQNALLKYVYSSGW